MTFDRSGGPHRRQYLPKLWSSRLLVCLVVSLLSVVALPSVASAAVTNASSNNQKMLEFMNAERAARGLSPLSRDPRLDSLAQSWANKMAAGRDMYHPGTPQAMSGAGYRSGAQNLAWHDTELTAAWAHNFWMNSSPHRKNILDPAFTHTGIAIACNPSGGRYPYVFATVEFGGSSNPLTSMPPASPHVAGSQSSPGAGCGGSEEPPPPPPPPVPAPAPAPAPVAAPVAPPATPKASPKPSASATPAKKASPTPSPPAKSSASPSPKPNASPSPAAAAAGTAPSPSPTAEVSPPPKARKLDSVAVADSRGSKSGSGPLVALIAALSGVLLATRVAARRRRVRPRHSISRR